MLAQPMAKDALLAVDSEPDGLEVERFHTDAAVVSIAEQRKSEVCEHRPDLVEAARVEPDECVRALPSGSGDREDLESRRVAARADDARHATFSAQERLVRPDEPLRVAVARALGNPCEIPLGPAALALLGREPRRGGRVASNNDDPTGGTIKSMRKPCIGPGELPSNARE